MFLPGNKNFSFIAPCGTLSITNHGLLESSGVPLLFAYCSCNENALLAAGYAYKNVNFLSYFSLLFLFSNSIIGNESSIF